MKVVHILIYKSCRQVLHSSIRYKISSTFLSGLVTFLQVWTILSNFLSGLVTFLRVWTILSTFLSGLVTFLWFWTILSTFFRSWSFISIHFFFISGQLCPLFYRV